MLLKKHICPMPRQARDLSEGVKACKVAISERKPADYNLYRGRLLNDVALLLAWLDNEAAAVMSVDTD